MSTIEQKKAPKRPQHGYIYACVKIGGKFGGGFNYRLGSAFDPIQKTDEDFDYTLKCKCYCSNVKLAEEKTWEQLAAFVSSGTPEDFTLRHHTASSGITMVESLITEICEKVNRITARLTFPRIDIETATIDMLMEVPTITKEIAGRILNDAKIAGMTEEMIHHLKFYTNIMTPPEAEPVVNLSNERMDYILALRTKEWTEGERAKLKKRAEATRLEKQKKAAELVKERIEKQGATEDKKTLTDTTSAPDTAKVVLLENVYNRKLVKEWIEKQGATEDKKTPKDITSAPNTTKVALLADVYDKEQLQGSKLSADFYNDFCKFVHMLKQGTFILWDKIVDFQHNGKKDALNQFIADFESFALKTKQDIDNAREIITQFKNGLDGVTPTSPVPTASGVTNWTGSDSDDDDD